MIFGDSLVALLNSPKYCADVSTILNENAAPKVYMFGQSALTTALERNIYFVCFSVYKVASIEYCVFSGGRGGGALRLNFILVINITSRGLSGHTTLPCTRATLEDITIAVVVASYACPPWCCRQPSLVKAN